jgi:hypothetical protein
MSKEKKWQDFTDEDWENYQFYVYNMKDAVYDLQKKLNFDPPLEYEDMRPSQLYSQLAEVSTMVKPQYDKKKLKPETLDTIRALELPMDGEEPKDHDPNLPKGHPRYIYNENNLVKLKQIAKSNYRFKPLLPKLSTYHDAATLKADMIAQFYESEEEFEKKVKMAESYWVKERKKNRNKNMFKLFEGKNKRTVYTITLAVIYHTGQWPDTASGIVGQVIREIEGLQPHQDIPKERWPEREIRSLNTIISIALYALVAFGMLERDNENKYHKTNNQEE